MHSAEPVNFSLPCRDHSIRDLADPACCNSLCSAFFDRADMTDLLTLTGFCKCFQRIRKQRLPVPLFVIKKTDLSRISDAEHDSNMVSGKITRDRQQIPFQEIPEREGECDVLRHDRFQFQLYRDTDC